MATTKTLEGPIIKLATSTSRGTSLYLTYIVENQYSGTTVIKYSIFDEPLRMDDMYYYLENTGLQVGDPIHVNLYDNLPTAITYWYTNPVTDNTFRTTIDPYIHDLNAVITEIFNGGNSVNVRRWLLEDITLIVNSVESYDLSVSVTGWFGMNINTNVTLGLADYGIITMAPTAFTDEASPSVQYINPRGTDVSVLQVGIARADNDAMLVPYRDVDIDTSGSYTFNFTTSELNAFYSFLSTTTNGRIYFALKTTVDGKTNVASSYATLSLVNHTPLIAPDIVDTNSKTLALTGDEKKFIKYHSNAHFSVNATARKGASIASYYTTHNGAIYRGATGTVNNIEQTKFALSATDTRELTASQTINVSMIDYIRLTCNMSAELPTTNDTIKLTVWGNSWNGDFGARQNYVNILYRYKSNTNDSYTGYTSAPIAPTYDGNTYSATFEINVPNHVDRYTLQVKAVDALSSVESKTVTVQSYPLFDWSDEDFNFNVPVSIQSDLSVAGNITLDGSQLVDFVVDAGASGIWTWRKWASGIAECWGTIAPAAHSITNAWGSIYTKDNAIARTSYPFNFTDVPVVSMTLYNTTGNCWYYTGTQGTNALTPAFGLARGTSGSVTTGAQITAIGRWK